MPRMHILNSTEQELFEKPPLFDSHQRKKSFDFPKLLLETAQGFRKPAHQIGFLLACGYFNAAKRFFMPQDYYKRDIDYVAHRLNIPLENFDPVTYTDRTRQRHEHIILDYYGFKRFDGNAENLISCEITTMVRAQLKPKLIFGRCLDILNQNRIQLPNSRRITDLIRIRLNQRKRELAKLIEQNISPQTRELLENLFVQDTTSGINEPHSANARYKLTLLKKFSHSTKPAKVKERVADLQLLEDLYKKLQPILCTLELGHEGIRYYAGSVIKSEIFQLTRRTDEDRYVHATAFVAHQYYRLQDNLVDVLLSAAQSFQNSARREHKEQIYGLRKVRNQALSGLLSSLDDNVFCVLGEIRI